MFDYLLILVVLLLVSTGIMFIYSSGINAYGFLVRNEYKKQIVWACIGVVFMLLLTIYDYRKLEKKSVFLFVLFIFLLLYTLLFGKYVNGAKSWIGFSSFGIQPSEFGKLIFILFLASFLSKSPIENQLLKYTIACCILLIPLSLILLQPDLGTAVVYIPIFLLMCFMANVPLKYLLYTITFGSLSIAFTVLPIWNTYLSNKSYTAILILNNLKIRLFLIITLSILSITGFIIHHYFNSPKYIKVISIFTFIISLSLVLSFVLGKVLKDYQIMRLIIFMNPEVDPQGAGWNIIQSKIAIGSGGAFGQGYLQGTQSHYRFLPEQSTDFIFSILSEELGFTGCIVIFMLYLIILLKILYIMKKCTDKYALYICAGILALFCYHFFINVGMVMGIMPITGIPLLFLSYGGSSLMTSMCCVGIVMSIGYRKNNIHSKVGY